MSRLSDPLLMRETQYGYYSAWQHSAIRALIAMVPFRGDHAALGAALRPPLSAQEVQKSVKLLLDLGLVEKTADGTLQVTAATITTGRKASALQVDLFHQQTFPANLAWALALSFACNASLFLLGLVIFWV